MYISCEEDKVKLAIKKIEEAEEVERGFFECIRIVEEVSAALNEVKKIENELLEINSKLQNYDYIDSIVSDSKELKKKNLRELVDILNSIKEPLKYFNNDKITNLQYIFTTERLSGFIRGCITKALISAMNCGGEAFVTNKDVVNAVKSLGNEMKQKFKATYFFKRKREYCKKMSHCKGISEEIVKNLAEHEVSLFQKIFEGEDTIAFLSGLLNEYFDTLTEEEIKKRLHKYNKDGDPFSLCLSAYLKNRHPNVVHEI